MIDQKGLIEKRIHERGWLRSRNTSRILSQTAALMLGFVLKTRCCQGEAKHQRASVSSYQETARGFKFPNFTGYLKTKEKEKERKK